ncbi:MAG: alpha-1,2-fucosyltransferase [Ferruginibacter sp.]
MIVFQIMGGLGNQMFQYAAARALSLKRNIPFKIDFDDPYKFVQRKLSLDIFNLEVAIATKKELNKCKPKVRFEKRLWMLLGKDPSNRWFKEKKGFHFDPGFFECPDGTYVSGFWQAEQYFKDIEDIIRTDFQFSKQPSQENTEWMKKIAGCNAVSIHVRRGDYITVSTTNQVHGACGPDYYAQAITSIAGLVNDPVFFFFSDDMNWVKENIKTTYPSHYVDTNDDAHNYEDMRLMSLCKHHIIANSSFSWWGAWLNPSKEKKVIAPRRWMNDTSVDTTDLIPSSWIRI